MNKNILILTNYDAGLYLFRKELLKALVGAGNTVHVSTPDTGYADRIEATGAVVHPSQVDRRGTDPLKDLKLYRYYRHLIAELSPDVVLTYTIKPIVYGGVAARKEHVPVLANVTGLSSAMLHGSGVFGRFLTVLYKAGLKGASCVFFQNEQNLKRMTEAGCVPEKAEVILLPGSGVNTEEHAYKQYPSDDPDGRIRLLYVGRIHDTKGSRELFEAAEKIHSEHPDVVFDIVGDCEEDSRAEFEPVKAALTESGAAVFYGYRDDVDTFYEKCHALVHPTYFEGMSNVMLEAASCGRPVIASDVPGCREIFEDGISGIAFEPKDTDSLVAAIERFIDMDPESRSRMGEKARRYVQERFDRQKVVDEYIKAVERYAGS